MICKNSIKLKKYIFTLFRTQLQNVAQNFKLLGSGGPLVTLMLLSSNVLLNFKIIL